MICGAIGLQLLYIRAQKKEKVRLNKSIEAAGHKFVGLSGRGAPVPLNFFVRN
jgi:hypothetical protein